MKNNLGEERGRQSKTLKPISYTEEYQRNIAKLNKPYSWGAYIDRIVRQLLQDTKLIDERLKKIEERERDENFNT